MFKLGRAAIMLDSVIDAKFKTMVVEKTRNKDLPSEKARNTQKKISASTSRTHNKMKKVVHSGKFEFGDADKQEEAQYILHVVSE